ncbi:MAG: class I SAM-dependent methyltransferase [Planctomycetota bacterium]|nr:MAG: class I SAM-dependent methyltransferase [Planctomycetota bacterium]
MNQTLTAPTEYLADTCAFHDKTYAAGYGHVYPESHVIRCYHQILRGELGIDGSRGESLLDYGCGSGANCAFFFERGFGVYGVDANEIAIRRAQQRLAGIADHFAVTPPEPDAERTWFGARFDIVFSNQVLYYFSNGDLRTLLTCFARQMPAGGILIASMMTQRHYFYRHSQPGTDGLRRVALGDPNDPDVFHINFVDTKDDVAQRFALFEPLHIGHYDCCLTEKEGSREHYLFIGRKRT